MATEQMKEGMREAIAAISRIEGMEPEARREYLEALGCVSIHFMRAHFGDDYARGWVEHALSDFDKPPMFTIRKTQ